MYSIKDSEKLKSWTVGREKMGELLFLYFPFPLSSSGFLFFPSPASLRHKEASAEETRGESLLSIPQW